MRCPHCGRDIDESVFQPAPAYCPYCGQNLGSTEGAGESMLFCPHCGKELPGKVNFCPYCGEEVARHVTTPYPGLEDSELAERRAKPIIELPPEQKKKSAKLYKQWMKYANLPPEAVPSTETPRETPAKRVTPARGEGNGQRFPTLYILLILGIVIIIVGFALILTQSC